MTGIVDTHLSGEWHWEHITPDLLQAERVKNVIYSSQTDYQSVIIQDTVCFGRSLVLDDKTQYITSPWFNHLCWFTLDQERFLLQGVGKARLYVKFCDIDRSRELSWLISIKKLWMFAVST